MSNKRSISYEDEQFDIDMFDNPMRRSKRIKTQKKNTRNWGTNKTGKKLPSIIEQESKIPLYKLMEKYVQEKDLSDSGWISSLNFTELVNSVKTFDKKNKILNQVGWNFKRHPDLLSQTGLNEEKQIAKDDYDKIISKLELNINKIVKKKTNKNYDWRGSANLKSKNCYIVADYLIDILNGSDEIKNSVDELNKLYMSTTSNKSLIIDINILKRFILFGASNIICNNQGIDKEFYFKMIYAISNIESSCSGWNSESYIIDMFINGLVGKTGFIDNPARRVNKQELYLHIIKLNKGDILKYTIDILNVFINNLKNTTNDDINDYVCYNGNYLDINDVIKISGSERRVFNYNTHWSESLTMSKLIDHLKKNNAILKKNFINQDVIDLWDTMLLKYDPSLFNEPDLKSIAVHETNPVTITRQGSFSRCDSSPPTGSYMDYSEKGGGKSGKKSRKSEKSKYDIISYINYLKM